MGADGSRLALKGLWVAELPGDCGPMTRDTHRLVYRPRGSPSLTGHAPLVAMTPGVILVSAGHGAFAVAATVSGFQGEKVWNQPRDPAVLGGGAF